MISLSHPSLYDFLLSVVYLYGNKHTAHNRITCKVKSCSLNIDKVLFKTHVLSQEQVCVVSKLSHRFVLCLLRKGHILHKESIPIWTYKIVLHCDISWVFIHHLPCSVKMCKKSMQIQLAFDVILKEINCCISFSVSQKT